MSFTPSRASVPIYLGAKGERALELSARIADGVLLSLLASPSYVSWSRQRTDAHETAAYVLVSCAADRKAAREKVRRPLAFYLGVHGDHDITRLGGLDPALAGKFRDGWLSGTPAEDLVEDQLIDTFAVAGDLSDCLAGLSRLRGRRADLRRSP